MLNWKSPLDTRQRGTHYADRMHRILGVCQDCGLLWHEERVSYRNGTSETRRVEDITAADTVLVTPQYEKYGLRVNPRVLPRLKRMAVQFAYALNVPSTSVEVDGNIVYIRVPLQEEGRGPLVTFEQAWKIQPDIPRGSLLLGVDEDQHQLVLELVAPTNVHASVIGMTGSGKSTLMRTMILSAQLIGGAEVALFDPSGGFQPFSGHPSVWRGGLFRTADDCEAGLGVLANSLARRREGVLYAFVDEVPELIMQRPRIREHLARLAQAGRHAGIHLVIGAQHLLASQVGPMTMRNIPVRLVGRVADRTAAYHATSRGDTGAEYLRGRGDFVAVNGSTTRHFQAACVTQELLDDWAHRFPPRAAVLPVRPSESLARPQPMAFPAPLVAQAATVDASADLAGGGGMGGGRPLDEIPATVVQEIQRYIRRYGEEPSSNWVYRVTRATVATGGFNRAKARRAIDLALRKEPVHA